MPSPRHVRILSVSFLLVYAFALPAAHAQQVVATWTDGTGTGNWSDAGNWSTLTVPNNGSGTTYNAVLTNVLSHAPVTLDVPEISINNLTEAGVVAQPPLTIGSGNVLNLVLGDSFIRGIVSNEGILSIGSSASFDLVQGIPDGTLFNTGYLINAGTIGNFANAIDSSGTFLNTSGGTINNDRFINSSGLFNNYGTIINTFTIPGFIENSGVFNNFGVINNNVSTFDTPSSTGVIGNGGVFNNYGTFNNDGQFTNNGSVTIAKPGLFSTTTNYTQTAGSTAVDGTLTATGGAIVDIEGGTLSGTGTINGNVLMAGTMTPGDAPGTLTLLGNYEQTGGGIFDEQMGLFSHGFLDVSGNVTLDPGASLEISLMDGFDPLGLTFSIMDFSTLSGQFANGSTFWDDNFLWDITYRQHEIDVTAVQAPEPGSLLLLAIGVIAISAFAKRKAWAQ